MSWSNEWEEEIYSKGDHFNEYPYDILVSIVARKYYNVENRKEIKILDLGCGAGNNSKFLAEQGFTVDGIDGASTAIKVARQNIKKNNLDHRANFKVGEFNSLPYEDEKFNCVIDRESIYANHKKNIKNIISNEVYRVLKDDGIFISFIYSSVHPQKEYGNEIEKNTYNNFDRGSFENTGVVHFVDLKEILEFYSKFTIKNIMKHKIQEIYSRTNSFLDSDEYIIIAEK